MSFSIHWIGYKINVCEQVPLEKCGISLKVPLEKCSVSPKVPLEKCGVSPKVPLHTFTIIAMKTLQWKSILLYSTTMM